MRVSYAYFCDIYIYQIHTLTNNHIHYFTYIYIYSLEMIIIRDTHTINSYLFFSFLLSISLFSYLFNIINSGKSYLRLEDYYCYLATSLHTLSKYQDANLTATGFNPQLLFEL